MNLCKEGEIMALKILVANCPYCSATYIDAKEKYDGFCQCKVCNHSFTLGKEYSSGNLNYLELLPVSEGESFVKDGYTVENGVLKSAVIDTDEVKIPKGVVIIGREVFKDNNKIKKVTMPDSVLYIGVGAFENCEYLREVSLPKKLLSIGNGAFYKCRRLTEIKIPQTLKYIGSNAFGNCDNITRLDIPMDLDYVGGSIYRFCKKLKNAVIPNCPRIDLMDWFSGLDSLEEIVVGKHVYSTRDFPTKKIQSVKFMTTTGWKTYSKYGYPIQPSELEDPKKAALLLYKLGKDKIYLDNETQEKPSFDYTFLKVKDE